MSEEEPKLIMMNHERPLDSLMPELSESRAPLSIEPVHQRVLEVETEAGFEWLLAVWRDPGGAEALHAAMKRLVEATLLSTLSQPPRRGEEELARDFKALRVMFFSAIDGDVNEALKPFGFAPVPYQADAYTERLKALTEEAHRMGWGDVGHPKMLWEASIQGSRSESMRERLLAVQAGVAEALGEEDWGQTPGLPSKVLADQLMAHFGPEARISPDLDGLDTLETLLITRDEGVIRWIPPLLFQGLADFIGVVIAQHYGLNVGWAQCEEDSFGLCPPPHFRLMHDDGREEHLGIGLFLLRWCVMPIQPGEEIPTLRAWLEDELGS